MLSSSNGHKLLQIMTSYIMYDLLIPFMLRNTWRRGPLSSFLGLGWPWSGSAKQQIYQRFYFSL